MAEIILNGPEGRLEGRYTAGTSPDAPIALVLHPHPLHGGSMNNKVVYNIYQAFAKRGFTVMRFNFRGVGRSQGSYGKGEGELADAATALDWLQQHYQNTQSCWIAGFSFGAWIALQLLMRRPEISSFVTASPPANLYDFNFLAPCPASGLILQGDADTIVPEGPVDSLVRRLNHQKNIKILYHKLHKADHFFSGQLEEVKDKIDQYLEQNMSNTPTNYASNI